MTARQPTAQEREVLAAFVRLEISIPALCEELHGMLNVSFGRQERRLTSHLLPAEPAIRIEMQHIENAMDRHRRGEISTCELSDWAAMLLMNDAYGWEGPDEDKIADLLNRLSAPSLYEKPV